MEDTEEKLIIIKKYTKKQAFERLVQIMAGGVTATDNDNIDSEYRKLIIFLGIDYI